MNIKFLKIIQKILIVMGIIGFVFTLGIIGNVDNNPEENYTIELLISFIVFLVGTLGSMSIKNEIEYRLKKKNRKMYK